MLTMVPMLGLGTPMLTMGSRGLMRTTVPSYEKADSGICSVAGKQDIITGKASSLDERLIQVDLLVIAHICTEDNETISANQRNDRTKVKNYLS